MNSMISTADVDKRSLSVEKRSRSVELGTAYRANLHCLARDKQFCAFLILCVLKTNYDDIVEFLHHLRCQSQSVAAYFSRVPNGMWQIDTV